MLKFPQFISLAVCAAVLLLANRGASAPPLDSQTISPLRAPRPKVDREDSAHEVEVGKKPVAVVMKLPQQEFQPGDEIELSVTLKIAPLWEIRTFDAKPKNVAMKLTLELPEGIDAKGDWTHPKPGRSLTPDGHPVFAGEVTFSRTLKVSRKMPKGKTAIKCHVHYQACRETRCLRPKDLELAFSIRIIK